MRIEITKDMLIAIRCRADAKQRLGAMDGRWLPKVTDEFTEYSHDLARLVAEAVARELAPEAAPLAQKEAAGG